MLLLVLGLSLTRSFLFGPAIFGSPGGISIFNMLAAGSPVVASVKQDEELQPGGTGYAQLIGIMVVWGPLSVGNEEVDVLVEMLHVAEPVLTDRWWWQGDAVVLDVNVLLSSYFSV